MKNLESRLSSSPRIDSKCRIASPGRSSKTSVWPKAVHDQVRFLSKVTASQKDCTASSSKPLVVLKRAPILLYGTYELVKSRILRIKIRNVIQGSKRVFESTLMLQKHALVQIHTYRIGVFSKFI